MPNMPYRARTATGDVFDIEFPLHAQTGDPVRVSQLVTLILSALDRDLSIGGETSNGDVLQAMAMATAIRAAMIHAPQPVTARLARELLDDALDAMEGAARRSPQSGRA